MNKYKLVLEYAGTRYSGWQEQKNATTVAGELRSAIEAAGTPVEELVGAGRTDAGVHALAQVAHAILGRPIDPSRLRFEVNARLPSDIHVLEVAAAHPRFHARHAATSRAYTYQVARRRTAFAKRYVWWVQRELSIDRIRQALVPLVGEHDFGAFCDRPQDQRTTRVRMDRAEIAENGSLVLVRFEASHFLWRMVRRLVGALVEIGTGELPVPELSAWIEGPSPSEARARVAEWTAPASGLFLERVRYEGDPPLGALVPPIAVS